MAFTRRPRLRRRHGPVVRLEGDVRHNGRAEPGQRLHRCADVISFVRTCRNLLREDSQG